MAILTINQCMDKNHEGVAGETLRTLHLMDKKTHCTRHFRELIKTKLEDLSTLFNRSADSRKVLKEKKLNAEYSSETVKRTKKLAADGILILKIKKNSSGDITSVEARTFRLLIRRNSLFGNVSYLKDNIAIQELRTYIAKKDTQ